MPDPAPQRRLLQLDGLRAFALIAVLLDHFWINTDAIPIGKMGLRLFFALSGFLITLVLLNCRDIRAQTGQSVAFTLRQFYIRRALRIFPLYYLTLAIVWYLNYPGFRQHYLAPALFLTNWQIAHTLQAPYGLGHFWTMAVQEQFYMVWPVLILLLPRRTILPTVIAATLSAPLWRALAYWHYAGAPQVEIRVLMPTYAQIDLIGVGAIVAVCHWELNTRKIRLPRLTHFAFWSTLISGLPIMSAWILFRVHLLTPLLSLIHINDPNLDAHLKFIECVLLDVPMALASMWLICKAADGFTGFPGRALEWRWLRFIGRISFGIYALQWLAGATTYLLLSPTPRSALHILPTLAALATVTAAGAASWFLFEQPFYNLKRFFPYRDSRRRAPESSENLIAASA